MVLEEALERLLVDEAVPLPLLSPSSSLRSLCPPLPLLSSSLLLLPVSLRSPLLLSESFLFSFSLLLLDSDATFLLLRCLLSSSSESSSLDSLDESLPLLLELEDDEEVRESLCPLPSLLRSFSACFRALSLLSRSLKRSSFSFSIWIFRFIFRDALT